jgi:ABC-type sugar transport system ATPase subunit
MSLLEARHIEKAFGRTHALRGVSLTVESGETVASTGRAARASRRSCTA